MHLADSRQSSWRRIKKDFLHHFHMPRVDLLVWILVTKLSPHYYRKLDHVINNHGRYRELPTWRKEFKREWKRAAKTPISSELTLTDKYKPDAWRWVCTCRHFVKSRFLVCKHLVQAIEPVPPIFFLEVQRNRTTPFWTHASLKPLHPNPNPSPNPSQLPAQVANLEPELNMPNMQPGLGDDCDEDSGSDDDDLVDTGAKGTFKERLDNHLQVLRDFCDILEHQKQFNDHRMLATVERDGAGLLRLARNCIDIEKHSNSSRSATPMTSDRLKTNTTFFRVRPRRSERQT
jgi:hypothetical protein